MTRSTGKANERGKRPGTSIPVIEREELEAFRTQLPTYRRYETYRFLTIGWDIVRALFIVHKYPRDPQRINVAQFARAYGFSFIPEGEPGDDLPEDSGFFHVDTHTVMSDQVNLERPVLIALVITEDKKQPNAILIDGLHRLFKAARLGRPDLAAHILTPKEERACRL